MVSTVSRFFIDFIILGLGIQFLWYAVPLIAVFFLRSKSLSHGRIEPIVSPRLIVLAPCFNGENNLPGFMNSMLTQTYPRDRYRIVIIADNCTDASAQRARELGADEVYVRCNPTLRGKGYALDEYFQQRLFQDAFDRLLLFDIDARVSPDYLQQAAGCESRSPSVFQGSTISKNPKESSLTRVGDLIQSLLRLHQYGRSLLRLQPLLIGSHGICIDRNALEHLRWSTAPKGPDGDDLELGLRSFLHGITVIYAPCLQVINDLPAQGQAIRLQRRRWTRSVVRLAPTYIGELVSHGLKGDWHAWDVLIGVLLLPSFSNFFLILTTLAASLFLISHSCPGLQTQAKLAELLWVLNATYLWIALWRSGARINPSDAVGIPFYLIVRAVALIESFIFSRSKEWWPTEHPTEKLETAAPRPIQEARR